MAKYKKGDRVKVINHKYGECGKNCLYFMGSMREFINKTVTIKKVSSDGTYYIIEGDLHNWSFTDCMLIPFGSKDQPLPVTKDTLRLYG